jgi:hypothetical protein
LAFLFRILEEKIDPLSETQKLYLSLNGRKFLEYANGATCFFHADHLGAPRVQSNLAGAMVETWRGA